MKNLIVISHFDRQYLAQASVMVDSLDKCSSEPIEFWGMWLEPDSDIFPVIPRGGRCLLNVGEIENADPRLKAIRGRSCKSWAWSLEPAFVDFTLKNVTDGTIVTYCDADVMWFADPIPTIHSVMEHADVALSAHHFPPGQESRERTVGKFNFGCGVFRACDLTRRIVGEWLDQTLEKCDEFGAGDQKYLDTWPDKLGNRLAELPHGINAGPWSLLEMHNIDDLGVHFLGIDGKFQKLISMHFHEFRRGLGPNPVTLSGDQWNRTFYPLKESTVESVYKPYEAELSKFL